MILFSRGDLPTKQSICTVLVVISLTRGLPEQYFRLGFHSTKHARQQNQAGVFPLAVSQSPQCTRPQTGLVTTTGLQEELDLKTGGFFKSYPGFLFPKKQVSLLI